MLLMLALAQAMASNDGVVAWLRTNAMHLKTVQAGNGFEDLGQFSKSLGGVRIVGMGEPTHGTREAFLFKHRMFEYLVERQGYRVFGIEASFPGCLEIEKYVQTGEGDPEAAVHGQGFWTWDTEEVLALVQWMRGYNKAHTEHVHFVGFDMQAKAPAYARALDYLKKWRPVDTTQLPAENPTGKDLALVRSLLDKNKISLVLKSNSQDFEIAHQCAVVATQALQNEASNMSTSFQALVKAHTQAKENVKALKKAGWDSKWLEDVLQNVDDGSAGKAEVALANERVHSKAAAIPPGSEKMATELQQDLTELARLLGIIETSVGWRDKCMADNVAWIVDTLYPRSKAMLWAHNYHIGSSIPTDEKVNTMGHHLASRFAKAYYPVGFCFGDGSFQARLLGANSEMGPLQAFDVGLPLKGSLDEIFSKAGSLYLITFDNAPKDVGEWLNQPRMTRTCGAGYDPKVPNSSYRKDSAGKWYRAMVFLGKTTRSRPLRLTRERFGIKKDW